jgi:hypothetical protein
MDYLQFLKRNKMHRSNRWIVKYHDKEETKVREVKLIFNPDEYRKMKRPRELHTQKQLIKILTKNKELCI